MREITLARGTEGDCYKCGFPITAGQFIIWKPTYHGGPSNTMPVHEKCSMLRSKKHGGKLKVKGSR